MGFDAKPLELENDISALYSLDKQRELRCHVTGVSISNGLAWTADKRQMYYVDSIPRKVYAFDYDIDTGMPSKQINQLLGIASTCPAPTFFHCQLFVSVQISAKTSD